MSKPDRKCGEEPTGIPRVDALREARRDLRFRLYVEVMIHSPSLGSLSGKTLDISERGFSATLPVELRCGEIVELNLKLRIGLVNVRAVVRDRNAFRHGFQFVQPNPALHLIRENCCLLERTDTHSPTGESSTFGHSVADGVTPHLIVGKEEGESFEKSASKRSHMWKSWITRFQ